MINIRKVASVLSSALMIGSTVGLAAAANFPAPYVAGGGADVAVVHGGANAAYTDLVAVTDIVSSLTSALASQTATGGTKSDITSSGGDVYPLFTSSSPLLMNSSLKTVRETLTDSELPNVMADGDFDGDVSASVEHRLTMGENPVISFKKQPTDDDDPQAGISLGTSASTQYIYNATIIFDEAVNFTHADSQGEDLTLFGQKFTISSATTTSKLIMFKSSETVFLDSDTNPSETVTVDGNEYTVELVSATDTSAEIKITDSSGNSEQKEISESASKKVRGIEVSVDTADESTALNKITASVIVGASKVTLQDGVNVKQGTDDKQIDGALVHFRLTNDTQTTYPGEIGKIVFQVAADDTSTDAIVPGQSFVDPIFGTFKIDFNGLNIPRDSTSREEIVINPSGSDKMTVTFKVRGGSDSKNVNWVFNKTNSINGGQQLADSDGDDIIVGEGQLINRSGYVTLGNEDTGGLFEVTAITNSSSSSASDDSVSLKNVMTGETKQITADTEGQFQTTLNGNTYTIKYYGASTISNTQAMQLTINSDTDSTGNDVVLFPTIETSKGAKLAFYEPTKIIWNDWLAGPSDLIGLNNASNVSNFKFPDGDGFTSIAVAGIDDQPENVTINSVDISTSDGDGDNSTTAAVGKLTYNFSSTGVAGEIQIFLQDVAGANIVNPAIVIFEEKDDVSAYETLIVKTDAGYDGGTTADLGVGDVERTWEIDTSANLGNEIQLESNEDLYEDMDIWGSIIILDKSDSNDFKATISYPDDQVEANIFVAEIGAEITGGTVGGGSVKELGRVSVSDSEVSSVSDKNLIVVGGSCVNSVAADLLGSSTPLCGANWESKTGVGAGSFLIETFARSGGKVATLVAGYNAGDTTNAATALTTQVVDTSVGNKYTGTSGSSITMASGGDDTATA
jgi:hypothetical protein